MSEQYTVDYFINKLEAIPEEKWRVGTLGYDGHCCALGHCGVTNLEYLADQKDSEGYALCHLFKTSIGRCGITNFSEYVWDINDNLDSRYSQPTPRARILAALADIKAKQEAA